MKAGEIWPCIPCVPPTG